MLTKIMIINAMLSAIGEGGVSTLNTSHPSVQTAERIFDTEDLQFQSRGWWFNTEQKLKLVPDNLGRVEIPENTLKFSVYDVGYATPTEKSRYVRRGQFVYDTIEHTTEINRAVYANITLRLDTTDMPTTAASYLKAKCCEQIYIDDDGDQFKTEKLERIRMEAWQAFKAEEMSVMAANALDNPTARALRSGYYNGGAMISIPGGGQR